MVLKLFNKQQAEQANEVDSQPSQDKMDRMENNLRELGLEVLRLRQEMNTMLARQQSFKMALGRLREYLEDRAGQQAEEREEFHLPLQELSHEDSADTDKSKHRMSSRKNKDNLH